MIPRHQMPRIRGPHTLRRTPLRQWPFGEWRWALLLALWPTGLLLSQPYDKLPALTQQAEASGRNYHWVRDTLLQSPTDAPTLDRIYFLADSTDRYVVRQYRYTPRELKRLRKALRWSEQPDHYDKAHRAWERLLRQQPHNTALMYYRALLYWQQGQYAEAATWARRAIRINTIHHKAYVLLARCELATGDAAAALRHISFAQLYNRNDASIAPLVRAIYARNKLVYDDRWQMQGHYTLSATDNAVRIVYDDEPWRALALCEALWTYEPHYEGIKTQHYLQPPSAVRRQACLYAWYETYLDWEGEEERKRKCWAAQAYEAAQRAELLEAFVLYEWTLVQEPTAAFLLSWNEREQVLRYLTTIRARREAIQTDVLRHPSDQ